MSTNVFFNNFNSFAEQSLVENLIIESIKIYGHEVYYLPKDNLNGLSVDGTSRDYLYGEDLVPSYTTSYLVEMYIKNVEGFEGQGDLLSKFNFEINDRITLTVARRVWEEEIGAQNETLRPNEGDVIYLPLTNKAYEVKFVEHEAIFYQMGSLQTYDITLELMEYSGQHFNTGIDALDLLTQNYALDLNNFSIIVEDPDTSIFSKNGFILVTEDGFPIVDEAFDIETIDPQAENIKIQDEASDFLDFTHIDPFSEGNV